MSHATARANGAVSVVNAIATGKGAALGIDLETRAAVELLEDTTDVAVAIRPDAGEDPKLVQCVVREVLDRLGATALGARVTTDSTIPVSRGLKSSSAAANAVALAVNAAHQRFDGRALPAKDVLDAAVTAALTAGVTVTGAFDDASASFHGGLCVTDNAARKLLARDALEDADLAVAVLVPDQKIRTLATKALPYAAIAPVAAEAHRHAVAGDWRLAMTLNGFAFGALYGIDPALTVASLAAGAEAASVSGTGPAFAAVAPRARVADVVAALQAFEGNVLVADVVRTRAEVVAS